MKKLIALTSMSLSIGFAFAPANADDNYNENSNQSVFSSEQQGGQQPGISETTQEVTTQTDTRTVTKSPQFSVTETCTDKTGNVLEKTDENYNSCVKSLNKNKKSNQMGGQLSSGAADLEHSE